MTSLLIILAAAAFLAVATVLDVVYTSKGIQAGVAVEANVVIVWLFGPRPTAADLYLHGSLFGLTMLGLALAGYFQDILPLWATMVGSMLAYGARHLQGAHEWARLLKK